MTSGRVYQHPRLGQDLLYFVSYFCIHFTDGDIPPDAGIERPANIPSRLFSPHPAKSNSNARIMRRAAEVPRLHTLPRLANIRPWRRAPQFIISADASSRQHMPWFGLHTIMADKNSRVVV